MFKDFVKEKKKYGNRLSYWASRIQRFLSYKLSTSLHRFRAIINVLHVINLGRYCCSYIRGGDISPAIITTVNFPISVLHRSSYRSRLHASRIILRTGRPRYRNRDDFAFDVQSRWSIYAYLRPPCTTRADSVNCPCGCDTDVFATATWFSGDQLNEDVTRFDESMVDSHVTNLKRICRIIHCIFYDKTHAISALIFFFY